MCSTAFVAKAPPLPCGHQVDDYTELLTMPIQCRAIGSSLVEEVLPAVLEAFANSAGVDLNEVIGLTYSNFEQSGMAWLANGIPPHPHPLNLKSTCCAWVSV